MLLTLLPAPPLVVSALQIFWKKWSIDGSTRGYSKQYKLHKIKPYHTIIRLSNKEINTFQDIASCFIFLRTFWECQKNYVLLDLHVLDASFLSDPVVHYICSSFSEIIIHFIFQALPLSFLGISGCIKFNCIYILNNAN